MTYPVPVHEDRCLDVVKGQVAGGELLIPKEGSVLSTIEGKIGHEATGSIVHEDALDIELESASEC